MKKKVLYLALPAAILALVGTGIWAVANAPLDCPGKIVCPMTGGVICPDQCPFQD